ncbi:MAG: cation diffusion facilitator family transporter [Dehalococcoidia bacterium]
MVHHHGPAPGSADGPSSALTDRTRLAVALGITVVFLVVEIVGGLLTNSLALLADAAHMGADVAALSLALFAGWVATRPSSPRRSYGYHRAEILAALFNGAILVAVSAAVIIGAARRLQSPPEVDSGPMLIVASLGLLANLGSASVLLRSSRRSLNVRGALYHVMGDTLGSVGAIVAGALMVAFSWFRADPIIGIFIGGLILMSSFRLLWPAVHILLEGTPRELDLEDLEQTIVGTEGVRAVHDLHAWALTSGLNAMTAHVVVDERVPPEGREAVLERLRHSIPDRFPMRHLPIQLEETGTCCQVAHLPPEREGATQGRKHVPSRPGRGER